MDLYLATNPIGARDGYSGADATAIGGSGHTAILKQLLKIDERLAEVGVDGYF